MASDDEGVRTTTTADQKATEIQVAKYMHRYWNTPPSQKPPMLCMYVHEHVEFVRRCVEGLGDKHQALDASQPWLCYWSLNTLELLGAFPDELASKCAQTLAQYQDSKGGFGGGRFQVPHLAATYAAVNAVVTVGTEEAYQVVNRETMYNFLMRMKNVDGSFNSHTDGECDIRGAYCAIATAAMLNIDTPELVRGTAEWIGKCQTYEGGLGGYPGNEAHGGYTFCGLAALAILKRFDVIDLPRMLHWVVDRQMLYEGGFQGRTNKLVDSCYSFWQGALFPLLVDTCGDTAHPDGGWLFDPTRLREYICLCCQDLNGGLRDKPGKSRDLYHTCYSLCGASIAQRNAQGDVLPDVDQTSVLQPVNAQHGISESKFRKAEKYFSALPKPRTASEK
eukprot:TRINITY_DN16918_c0_g1_i1.p1 TRINITY_DN16918_c0_g1~~TRINITY_DN16918_c0_g1_i1.p1  ORF type:complete len:392 (-),score=75.93 TRINITY_DN16918_c0_g1_i1:59-1234(-)